MLNSEPKSNGDNWMFHVKLVGGFRDLSVATCQVCSKNTLEIQFERS